jgi:hypothetical protein
LSTVAGRRQNRNDYRGNREWNIFRRYFIDPDYGLSRNRCFTLAKKPVNPGTARA